MDPLSALSIACSVMQVISFGLETISLCTEIYKSGHPDLSLAASGRHLEDMATSITQQLICCPGSLTAKDKAFIKVANQCADDAKALQDEAAYLEPKKAHEIRAAICATFRTFRHKRRLEKLKKNLLMSQRTLESSLLGRVCDETRAHAVQNRNDFANLDRTLQHFVKQYAEGQRTLSGLLQSGFQTLENHVTMDGTKTRQEITAHVTNELVSHHNGINDTIAASTAKVPQDIFDNFRAQKLLEDTARKRQRLLESLKHPEANARYNKISGTCPETFEWVFDENKSNIVGQGHPQTGALEWLKSDGNLFWISGKPGSGKSTLSKFIVNHPATQEALGQWRQRTRVVSHFFWLPGNEMQKSIQGMLCSLLHQSLLKHFSALGQFEEEEHCMPAEDSIFLRFPKLKEKSYHSDWSMEELTDVLIDHLEFSSYPYCFFLDGLDEVFPKDGPDKLLRLLDRLMTLPSVKLCVSSRPENVFRKHFEYFPSLRMQDLIAPDIYRYAYKVFEEQTKVPDLPGRVDSVVDTIVSKAEGVFLWAVLVLESFKRGLTNGDTWEELEMRLNTVPTDLMDFYRDMWSRHRADRKIYQQTAALYISLRMKYNNLDEMEESFFTGSPERLTVMDFMAASSSESELDEFLGQRAQITSFNLKNNCEQAITYINVRCAGLLVVSPRKGTTDLEGSEWWQRVCRETSYGSLLRYLLMEVDFVHRSAYDFLNDTEDGQQIWKDCGLTDFQLLCQLVTGRMARLRVLGSIAPWMHENGNIKVLQSIEDVSRDDYFLNVCPSLSNATETQKITSAEAEILLSIVSRASINRDLTFTFNPKKPAHAFRNRLGRPPEFLPLVFAHFDTFFEDYIVRHADSLTADTLCYVLADMYRFLSRAEKPQIISSQRMIGWLLQRLDHLSKSRDADSDAPIDMYAQMACDEFINRFISNWYVVREHCNMIPDIFATLLRAGADLDRRLYFGIRCECDYVSPESELRVVDVIYHPDKAFVLPDHNVVSKSLQSRIVLEVSVSFAIQCAMVQHFGQEEDRFALVGHKGHPYHCRVLCIDSVWFGPEEEDDKDLSRLTSLLASRLIEGQYGDCKCFDLAQKLRERGPQKRRIPSGEYSDSSGGSDGLT